MDPQHIEIYQDANVLFERAASFIIDIANKAVKTKGRFVVSLSGGKTPEQLYSILSKNPFCEQMPWKNTFIFWGDERSVPLNDTQNNAHMAALLLLDKITIPATNIHPIPVNLSPVEAAKKYEKEIKDYFKNELPRFDLILLGLGENGHTASLFPGTDILYEQKHWIKEVYIDEQKMFRISMTAILINQAHHIVFLITGEKKAAILKKVLSNSYQPYKYPAQLIRPEKGELYWFADNEAAALL